MEEKNMHDLQSEENGKELQPSDNHSAGEPPKDDTQEPAFKNGKESFYDKIPIDLRTLDKVIIFLFAVLILMIILGMLKSHFH